ncbi:odorant receptor 4-like [Colletes gigas]|uniref:odorant receptor 4-like n=1 Tax=Colletes gigas TaxID=935657 RepID=UPI001C9B80FC|nr:odorant receptor 4-like [Colletes gigas]
MALIMVKDDLVIRDPQLLNDRIFRCTGICPKKRNKIIFTFSVVYYTVHIVLGIWDFIDYIGIQDHMVHNLLESILTISTLCGMLVVAKRGDDLKTIIETMRDDMKREKLYDNIEEKRLYYYYNSISYNFCRYAPLVSFTTVVPMYIRPLIEMHGSKGVNGSLAYRLPFRSHMIFDYRTPSRYAIVYVYQFYWCMLPMIHIAEVGLIVNLALHCCAKVSILAHRIRNIQVDSTKSFKDGIRKTVIMHLEVREYYETLNNNFNMMLLIELMSCGVRLSLSLYFVLIKLDVDMAASINFMIHTFVVGAYLYVFSYIGEQVVYESQQLGDAFYNVRWVEVNSQERKALLMCMMNGQKTMYITAGKFYTFSLFGFTEKHSRGQLQSSQYFLTSLPL